MESKKLKIEFKEPKVEFIPIEKNQIVFASNKCIDGSAGSVTSCVNNNSDIF